MQVVLDRSGVPAGITVHTTPEGATISMWAGSREMIAHLDPERGAEVARILSAQHGHMQIAGTVHEFIAPHIS